MDSKASWLGDPESDLGPLLYERCEGNPFLLEELLKAALDGLKAKSFSSVELTTAHVEAVEAARALNAFVLETPEQAIEMAKAVIKAADGDVVPLKRDGS